MSETQQYLAHHEEICNQALEHYMRISKQTCEWNSVIPEAIEFYKRYARIVNSVPPGKPPKESK